MRYSKIILLCLIMSGLLNDLVAIEFAGIWLQPYRITLALSILYSVLFFKTIRVKKKPIVLVFFALLLFHFIYQGSNSIIGFYTSLGELSLFLILQNEIFEYKKLLKRIAIFLIILMLIQWISGTQILQFGLQEKITYNVVPGVLRERLNNIEFLILGLPYMSFIITLIVGVLIFVSASFTGVIMYSLLIIKIYKLRIAKLLFLGTLMAYAIYFTNPDKFKSYFLEGNEKNWRVVSSLVIVDDWINDPYLVGHGFQSNQVFLMDTVKRYLKVKFNRQVKAKAMNTHTLATGLYDYGFLYLLLAIMLLIMLLRRLIAIENTVVAVVLIVIMGRLMFYYHGIGHWTFFLLMPVLNSYDIKPKQP